MAETFVDINQRVSAGQPLFRLDSTEQEAALETAKRQIAEVDATMVVAKSQLAEAEGKIVQARGALQQATDEYETRAELFRRNSNAIAERDVQKAQVMVDTAQGAVDAAVASKASVQSQIDFQLPAQKASAEATLQQAQVELDKSLVVAGTDGMVQQFALRPGDVVNPMLRPAGILVPERHVTGLIAGFGQIESQVMKVGMVGEVTCVAIPFTIIPVVVTQVQDVIASGQVRPTDQLVGRRGLRPARHDHRLSWSRSSRASSTGLPQGSSCIANAYTSNHDALQDPNIGAVHAVRPACDRRHRPRARDAPAAAGADPAVPDAGPGRRPLTDARRRRPLAPAGAGELRRLPAGLAQGRRRRRPRHRRGRACPAPSPIRRSPACRRRPASTPRSRRSSPTPSSARRAS